MKSCLIPAILLFLSTSACVDHGDESGTEEDIHSVSERTLETMLLDSPIVRGFVADGSGCETLGDPVIVGSSITFILTNHFAERVGRGLARSVCDLVVEIEPPDGARISLEEVFYRGFAQGVSARSSFFREYFVGGLFTGDRRITAIDYGVDGRHIVVRDDSTDYADEFGPFTALDAVVSAVVPACGEPTVWRTNTLLSARVTDPAGQVILSFDTSDVADPYFVTFRFGPPTDCL